MLDLLTKAKNAIDTYNTQLRINSSNIANMSVPGYKAMKVSFQSLFEQLINSGTAASDKSGGKNPLQLGSTVGVSDTSIDFTQGSIAAGDHLDLAINGTGLFIVSPDGGNTMLYTRAGKFHVDNDGNLVTDTGMQVYGFKGGNLTPITGLNSYQTGFLTWSDQGQLVQYNDDNWSSTDPTSHFQTADTGYTIGLTTFTNNSGLEQGPGTTFVETGASGVPLDNEVPGADYGTVSARSFEQSNVFYTGEILDSMEAQRAMSGNLTIAKMISDEISQFISKIS